MGKAVAHARIGEVFHALGDPTRRAMVERLSAGGPLSVSALAEPLGVTVTAIGQHLQILERSGLVRSEKSGRTRTCRLEKTGLAPLERWVRDCKSRWEERLDRLEELLAEDESTGPAGHN